MVLACASAAAGDSPVRVIAAWASPPNTQILAMLGETSAEAPAALRVIRHRLEQKRAEGMWTFGVTSARDGEGKSTFATQLALVLSESQRARVLLIEANFVRPSLAQILGFRVPDGYGFSAQIVRKMRGSMEPWCVVALGPALHVLAESLGEQGFPETLHSTHFQNAIGFLGRGYDFLIVDAPTILGSGDANVVENAVDGVIVIARSKQSKGSDVREALKQLGERKTVGMVLWDAASKSNGKSR
jgi:Mrp family chromosome partitioning ATPase